MIPDVNMGLNKRLKITFSATSVPSPGRLLSVSPHPERECEGVPDPASHFLKRRTIHETRHEEEHDDGNLVPDCLWGTELAA